jgi:hypothetical protein
MGSEPSHPSSWQGLGCLLALLLLTAPSRASDTSDWMSLDGNILELKLAHDEGGRLDGGVLRIDPTSHILAWNGIPGDLGCRDHIEVPFEDVRSIRLARGSAGFVVLVRDKKALTLLPVVDADWFRGQWKVTETATGFNQAMKESLGAVGGESNPNPFGTNGASAFGGPRVERIDLPEEVVANTKLAVDGILQALGRTLSPGLRVREALYGSPEDVVVEELAGTPASFEGLAVRVRGRIETAPPSAFALKAGESSVSVVPTDDIKTAFLAAAHGGATDDVELTGVFRHPTLPNAPSSPTPASGEAGVLTFWDFVPATSDANTSGPEKVSLERLVNESRAFEGKTIRVIGKYRGNNLFADLPTASWKNVSDFVIKEESSAVWVTGKRSEGKGWHLDPSAPGDTQNWVEVVGRPRSRAGIVYLHASSVSVTTPPSGHASVTQPKRFVGGARVAPEVMFVLPLPEEPIPRNGLFVIQFTKAIEESSFKDRVELRYVGDGHPDHAFTHMTISYDEDRRALVINPGELLVAGREVEVLLRPGIVDSDGLSLRAPPGDTEAVYRLRYTVRASAGPVS